MFIWTVWILPFSTARTHRLTSLILETSCYKTPAFTLVKRWNSILDFGILMTHIQVLLKKNMHIKNLTRLILVYPDVFEEQTYFSFRCLQSNSRYIVAQLYIPHSLTQLGFGGYLKPRFNICRGIHWWHPFPPYWFLVVHNFVSTHWTGDTILFLKESLNSYRY